MPVLYQTFIRQQFRDSNVKEYYKSFCEFQNHYILSHGFSEWLETLQGHNLSLSLVNNIAKVFVKYGRRSPNEIPMVLSSISRQYDAEIPIVAGILTGEYWREQCFALGIV